MGECFSRSATRTSKQYTHSRSIVEMGGDGREGGNVARGGAVQTSETADAPMASDAMVGSSGSNNSARRERLKAMGLCATGLLIAWPQNYDRN
jgi:hypothetical protein